MKLARPSRQTHRAGSTLYATVEGVALGKATVRLTGGGARLTNLPVLDAQVDVGDTVIVDYASGDQPYVRPVTIYEPEVEEVVETPSAQPEAAPQSTGLIAAKIKHTASQSIQTSYWPLTNQSVLMNTTVYDYGGCVKQGPVSWMPAGGKVLVAPVPGKYFCRVCLAAETMSGQENYFNDWKIGIRGGTLTGDANNMFFSGYLNYRIQRFNGPGGVTQVMTSACIRALNKSEYIVPRIMIAQASEPAPMGTMPALDNVYPTMEFVLIAKMNTKNKESVPWWYYEVWWP